MEGVITPNGTITKDYLLGLLPSKNDRSYPYVFPIIFLQTGLKQALNKGLTQALQMALTIPIFPFHVP